jgi:hypothetical protein
VGSSYGHCSSGAWADVSQHDKVHMCVRCSKPNMYNNLAPPQHTRRHHVTPIPHLRRKLDCEHGSGLTHIGILPSQQSQAGCHEPAEPPLSATIVPARWRVHYGLQASDQPAVQRELQRACLIHGVLLDGLDKLVGLAARLHSSISKVHCKTTS